MGFADLAKSNGFVYQQLLFFVWHWNMQYLGGGFKYFLFSSYLGKVPILTDIFQMGWNHQADMECGCFYTYIFIRAVVGTPLIC